MIGDRKIVGGLENRCLKSSVLEWCFNELPSEVTFYS